MTHSVTVLRTKDAEQVLSPFATDVARGLWSTPKIIPSRNFYDERGSELFAKITTLPSYYPTRTETNILRARARDISSLVGSAPTEVVELGCGCGEKTFIILDQLIRDGRDIVFRPLDISQSAMNQMSATVEKRYGDNLRMQGVVGEYIPGLAHIDADVLGQNRKKLILFFGSNIGNMTDTEAVEFLLKLHVSMKQGDLLIVGFDLKKELRIIHQAYDDPEGVTREFNLNLLDRMNRELGANFNRAAFVHHPFYDPSLEAMVSWLVSTKEQDVSLTKLPHGWVHFREGEGIRTEMSRKFSFTDIRTLAERSRFRARDIYTDAQQWFADVVLQPF